MKKFLIGSIVGGIIFFAWQFLSWNILPVHEKAYQYTDKQDAIITFLNSQFSEDGQYMLPSTSMNASSEERTQAMENMKGKPWAVVSFHKAYSSNLVVNMLVGILVDIILVMLFIRVIAKQGSPSFASIFMSSLTVGLICFLFFPYTEHNWFQTPRAAVTGHLIDSIVAWSLVGLWLGWLLGRKVNP